ncbi:MAG: alpha,alpha-trehalose-phosphate synthase (UDP-forming), partial [Actinomycetota bacterium]
MIDDTEVVLASNRGPVAFVASDDGFALRRGAGGLVGALGPVARRLGSRAVWIAATTSEADRAALAAGRAEHLSEQLGYPVLLIDVDREIYTSYYDVISNRMLWFANHCLWDELGEPSFGDDELGAWTRGYEEVNRRFADAVLETAETNALVLFHDYHLTRAPLLLRERRPGQTIGHFTHSSFCARGMKPLPEVIARAVIEGMLGANLVAFHVDAWAQGFLDCCEQLGWVVDRAEPAVEGAGRRTWVRTYPIQVDVDELRSRAAGGRARSWAHRFREEAAGPLIVRVDRTEPSKNVVRGFEAFGRLLDRRPDLRSVRFVACLYPSRQSMAEYRRYAAAIEDEVRQVNDRHPGSIVLSLEDDFDRSLGALLCYDVLLVNPLMDGMNLVSKEGVALNENHGALVLSRFAGSFEELGAYAEAIDDPRDIDATAAALERALALPEEERRARARGRCAAVERRTPEQWIEAQLDDLRAIRDGARPR